MTLSLTEISTPAPGEPGIVPRWTSSAKIGVGTAMTYDNNIWFTLSHGIVNEIYFPRVDIANIRDLQFIVTDGKTFFSEEKRDAHHEYATYEDGVPAFYITNTCLHGRYRIEKKIITDPRRKVLIQEVQFIPLKGSLEDYHLYALLSPHIFNAGMGNNGWTGNYKGTPMMFAEHRGIYLAFAAETHFSNMSCGYVGTSDAWQDLHQNKKMTQFYSEARNGNIALAGEINLQASGGKFVLGVSFAGKAEGAGVQLRASLMRDFNWTLNEYVQSWNNVQKLFLNLSKVDKEGARLYRTSTAVLKTHEGKNFSGSVIASLSIPWGFARGDHEIGGYHLIWPRDQVQTADALLAAGDLESARQSLLFLMCTQESDGHWMQCMWQDGVPYWEGLQLDETALPILLAEQIKKAGFLEGIDPCQMVMKAASFLIRNGPITEQDRWEENSGYTPFTLALEIAALLIAADFFQDHGRHEEAEYLRQTADWWNESIERWLYVKETPLANKFGVEGYYVRLAPVKDFQEHSEPNQMITIKNRRPEESQYRYSDIVSVDALAFVRYGLRAASDPFILNTVKVIDGLLKIETNKGPCWHRYNEDGYGEHEDGSPFDGTGIGRVWPLLVGERAHYELAKGNKKEALHLLRVMANLAGTGGLLPEQIWDGPDIPEKSLYNGHSAGSAKPLVWAHAEYITLIRSLKEGKVFNMPHQTVQRYIKDHVKAPCAIWRFNHKCDEIPIGKALRIQTMVPAKVHWSTDNWVTVNDGETLQLDLGIHYVDLPLQNVLIGTKILFTFFWPLADKWEEKNYDVVVKSPP